MKITSANSYKNGFGTIGLIESQFCIWDNLANLNNGLTLVPNPLQSQNGNCYKFKKNVTCDLYLIFIDKPFFRLYNYDGISNNEVDLMRDPGTWSIKNNSTFVWDEEIFKIENCQKKKFYYCIITMI